MSRDRTEELLIRCVEYIDEMLGCSGDTYDVMTNVIGFTESELDSFVHGETDPTDDNMVFCEDVTGVLGQMFACDMSGLPEDAVRHLQDAYQICAMNGFRLTNEQYNVLNKIAAQTKMDCWFYIHTRKDGSDVIRDLENSRYISLKSGVAQLNEGIVADLVDLTPEEWNAYDALLERLGIANNIDEIYQGNANGIVTSEPKK